MSVFKLLAGVLWRQAFAKDLGFEHMFERRRLARMADSGGGGGKREEKTYFLPYYNCKFIVLFPGTFFTVPSRLSLSSSTEKAA